MRVIFFFFNDTATTEIYTLSLHDALPISRVRGTSKRFAAGPARPDQFDRSQHAGWPGHRPRLSRQYGRSEEHTSELQLQSNLVCRLLLEKKKHRKDRQGRPARIKPLSPLQ